MANPLDKLKAWWASLSKNEKIAVGVGVVAVVGFAIYNKRKSAASLANRALPATPRPAVTGPSGYSGIGGGGMTTSSDNALAIAALQARIAEQRIAADERIAALRGSQALQAAQLQAQSRAAQQGLSRLGASPGSNNPPSSRRTDPLKTNFNPFWTSGDLADDELLRSIDATVDDPYRTDNPFEGQYESDPFAFLFPEEEIPAGNVELGSDVYNLFDPSEFLVFAPDPVADVDYTSGDYFTTYN